MNQNVDLSIGWGNAWFQYSLLTLASLNSPTVTVLASEVETEMCIPADGEDYYSAMANGWDQPSWNGGVYSTGLLGGRAFRSDAQYLPAVHVGGQGSNFLAADGHVKYLVGTKVSGGYSAQASTNTQGTDATSALATAAGTGNLTDGNGATFTLTYSTI
jgi:prepilin-type processing-associated H-X9-DG protein